MADDETQGQQDTLWWSFDDFADPTLPTVSFDEPLVWPDALVWDDPVDAAPGDPLPMPEPPFGLDDDTFFRAAFEVPAEAPPDEGPPPEAVIDWGPPAEDPEQSARPADPLGALGGGAGLAEAGAEPTRARPVDDSIWAQAGTAGPADTVVLTTTPPVTSPVYADTEAGPVGRRRRFDVRPGNIAVIALISLASLVLLGMFLAVRGRDAVRTDTSETRNTTDGIQVTGTLNTVPLTTPASAPTPTINIAELVPPDDATTTPDATSPATAPRSATATTAAPTATTARPTQPTTATTAAPAPTTPETTTPPPTSPPSSDPATTIKRTTTSFVRPTTPTYTCPSIPNFTCPTAP